ncbi:hypothetical protein GCM10027047_32190 [Rhodococcus aerolatus]
MLAVLLGAALTVGVAPGALAQPAPVGPTTTAPGPAVPTPVTPTPTTPGAAPGTSAPTPTTSGTAAPSPTGDPTAGEGAPAEQLPGTDAAAVPDPAAVPAAPVEPAVTPAQLADVAEISRRLTELDALTTTLLAQVAAAQDTLDARRAEVATAAAAEDRATAAAQQARAAAEASRTRVDRLVAATYDGARTSRLSAVLVATGPQDLLDRMTGLTLVSEDAGRGMTDARTALDAADRADADARAASAAATAAEAEATAAQAAVVARRGELTTRAAEVSRLVARVQAGAAAGLLAGLDTSTLTGRISAVDRIRDAASGRPLYVMPTTGTYTSGFGVRWGAPHQGIDLANSIGTPVLAVADGTVVDAGPASGFGQWVRLLHPDGTITVYGHVDTYVVRVGQRVLAGDLIATMGNRGQSTGPHLHFEVVQPGGAHVDPVPWLAARGLTVR